MALELVLFLVRPRFLARRETIFLVTKTPFGRLVATASGAFMPFLSFRSTGRELLRSKEPRHLAQDLLAHCLVISRWPKRDLWDQPALVNLTALKCGTYKTVDDLALAISSVMSRRARIDLTSQDRPGHPSPTPTAPAR